MNKDEPPRMERGVHLMGGPVRWTRGREWTLEREV